MKKFKVGDKVYIYHNSFKLAGVVSDVCGSAIKILPIFDSKLSFEPIWRHHSDVQHYKHNDNEVTMYKDLSGKLHDCPEKCEYANLLRPFRIEARKRLEGVRDERMIDEIISLIADKKVLVSEMIDMMRKLDI